MKKHDGIKKCIVVYNKNIGSGFYHMKLETDRVLKVRPAQFINLKVSDTYQPLLRRPFSVFNTSGKSVEIVYKVLGEGTQLMSKMQKGHETDFIGPQGNSYFDFVKVSKIENRKSKIKSSISNLASSIILVGGGTGIASIHYLALELRRNSVPYTMIQGAQKKSMIIYEKKFRELGSLFSTNDGSLGTKGFVTDVLIKKIKPGAVIFACGPEAMAKGIRDAVKRSKISDVKIYASLEAYMGCGIGACISCVCAVGKKDDFVYKRVCKEGTVFDVKEVVL